MTIIERRNPYTVHFTAPMVTWTSSLLPVSRNRPEIVTRVPPALGPLEGSTTSGIGSWWGRRGGGHKIQHEYILIFPLQGFTCTHKLQPTRKHLRTHTRKNNTQIDTELRHIHTHFLSPSLIRPPSNRNIHTHTHTCTHTQIQAPHLPQFAEQTVRRSTPLWGSFSGARDMKSQLNSYAVAC